MPSPSPLPNPSPTHHQHRQNPPMLSERPGEYDGESESVQIGMGLCRDLYCGTGYRRGSVEDVDVVSETSWRDAGVEARRLV